MSTYVERRFNIFIILRLVEKKGCIKMYTTDYIEKNSFTYDNYEAGDAFNLLEYMQQLNQYLKDEDDESFTLRLSLFNKGHANTMIQTLFKILSAYPHVRYLTIEIYEIEGEIISLGTEINKTELKSIWFSGIAPQVILDSIPYPKLQQLSFRPYNQTVLMQYLLLNDPIDLKLQLDFLPTIKTVNESVSDLLILTSIDHRFLIDFISNFKNITIFSIEKEGEDTWM